mmetsp:Transcript_76322/g.212061  ORF Transcript_76322/g.212061 Transcript_76322/m.212061 type:complete len:352 (-) Transcript_76322:541-1596(-)
MLPSQRMGQHEGADDAERGAHGSRSGTGFDRPSGVCSGGARGAGARSANGCCAGAAVRGASGTSFGAGVCCASATWTHQTHANIALEVWSARDTNAHAAWCAVVQLRIGSLEDPGADAVGVVALMVHEALPRRERIVAVRFFHGDAVMRRRVVSRPPARGPRVHCVVPPESRAKVRDGCVDVPNEHAWAESRSEALRPRASMSELLAILDQVILGGAAQRETQGIPAQVRRLKDELHLCLDGWQVGGRQPAEHLLVEGAHMCRVISTAVWSPQSLAHETVLPHAVPVLQPERVAVLMRADPKDCQLPVGRGPRSAERVGIDFNAFGRDEVAVRIRIRPTASSKHILQLVSG